MINYLNRIKFLLAIFLLGGAACKKEGNKDFNLHAEVQLTSFKLHNVAGEINQQTGEIVVNLPFGTHLEALIPEIGLPLDALSKPAPGEAVNFTGTISYRITNGNIYKGYTVTAKIIPPLIAFRINDEEATIDHANRTVSLVLPDGTDLRTLTPEIELLEGVSTSPANNEAQDFSQSLDYTFALGEETVTYQVHIISNSISAYAFLGLAASREAIGNPDEKAAADWFFAAYPDAEYISFQSIASGRNLSNYQVIWWHFDAAQELPAIALTNEVINTLKTYRSEGGSLLLSAFAVQYVEALGVVPDGRGPNNVFGDFLPNGFIEENSDWGISFKGREDHPIFQGLDTFEEGKAYLLASGTFRLNHTAWWFLPEWGGYGDAATWRSETGGINLASEAWDDHFDGRVGIAEWPDSGSQGNVVIIAFGAYDWYSEPQNGASTDNRYMNNIRQLTKNTIDYLKSN
ncbi:DUF4960 domain-containing protein [Olivibacter sp. SDN3]|uniref:DUF4960 domain-containing protein n=1 Tax=Olivibacter sp. SDN3 TaxID=2764720 RepID=UPI0016518C85|nr:DUF4960 domain-containing protein [Olivibacter sp. SDN3]QNL49342.1 DUF4960 domain-containing protein [Olivibacter sp. SDN3]